MKDDDENEDMIFSFVFVAVTIFTVLFFVVGAGLIIWSFI
jgi:nitrate reductase NapE component